MHLANTLNAEPDCVCVHEGKFRLREESGEQKLPFLTLENRIAYEYPERAAQIIADKRGGMREVDFGDVRHVGDIAYNYCPFLEPLAGLFPDAKFIVIFRDGRTFVRSATLSDGEDEVPVGWPPADKELSDMERYISLGRLQPRRDSPHAIAWRDWDAFEKNTWLWAATNRIVLDALGNLPPERCLVVRFEAFVADPVAQYGAIREFLGFTEPLGEATRAVLESKKVNARKDYWLPAYEDWSPRQKSFFADLAGDVMERLDYPYEH